MNANFVCVKVDREERPDVDAIYMEAVQSMIGSGGWPLNVFLSPDQVPLYGGTYFPPEPRPGLMSWRQLLAAISATWSERRDELLARRRAPPAPSFRRRAARALLGAPRCSGARRLPSTRLQRALRRRARRLRRGAEVPSGPGAGVPRSRGGEGGDGARDAARHRVRAASTTGSAAASRATASTMPGGSRTSRRCSTTTRCSRAPCCTAGRLSGEGSCSTPAAARSTGR